MSHTIYGNKTKNGIIIDDMVDNNKDIVYPINKDYFVRLTICEEDLTKELKPALAVFSYKEPFTAIYGKRLEETYEKYSYGQLTTDLFAKELEIFKNEFLSEISCSK